MAGSMYHGNSQEGFKECSGELSSCEHHICCMQDDGKHNPRSYSCIHIIEQFICERTTWFCAQ